MKIIGGKFGLPEDIGLRYSSPDFLDGNPLLLFNVRSAIMIIAEALNPRKIWLPSFLCPTILSAFEKFLSRIEYFKINNELKLASFNIIDKLRPKDLFLFIDYFGFPFEPELISELRNKGVTLIQDCSQALFFDWKQSKADFCVYSPRKFVGVPDGGILHIHYKEDINFPKLQNPPEEILHHLFTAVIMRRQFDIYGGNRVWNKHFSLGLSQFTPGYFKMSEFSSVLLRYAFNYQQIQQQRRINYQILSSKLRDIAIFPDLEEDIVPFGFPIKVEKRNQLQKKLFQNNIYPPIHWNIKNHVPLRFSDSHQLSHQIMTLPCDQRYNEDDMNQMADIIKELNE